jgi:hypothetical protein
MTESNTEKKYLEREHNWKELLYTLFYEIKSEILGDKIASRGGGIYVQKITNNIFEELLCKQ